MAKRCVYDLTTRNLAASAEAVLSELTSLEKAYKTAVDGVLSGPPSQNFASTFGALAGADGEAAFRSITCVLPSLTSPCKEARTASADAKRKLAAMWSDAYSNDKLYARLVGAKEDHGGDLQKQRLIGAMLSKFQGSGAGLQGGARESFGKSFGGISSRAMQFEQNINEDVTDVALSDAELQGCSAEFIAGLPKNPDGLRVASIKAPTRVPIMQTATDPVTRKKMYDASCRACVDTNGPLLKELLKARHDAATSLGFPNHASATLGVKTARTEETAVEFCTDMIQRMRPKFEEESAALLREKQKDFPSAERVEPWDRAFYIERLRKQARGIDTEELKKYFPLRRTLTNILEIYAGLLGLRFEEDASLPRWDKEVITYSVFDVSGDGDASGVLKGYLYFDLFPREGKFGHQMILPLSPAFSGCLPACCYMGNLSKPDEKGAAFLRLSEVQTMFHELGHMMHCVCAESDYSMLSWAWPMVPWPGGVEQDFLEVPSTMFEQWMLEPEVVQRVASEVDGKAISPDTVLKLKESSRYLSVVEFLMRYYAMSLADLRLHGGEVADPQKVYADVIAEVTGEPLPEGSHPAASWYHLAIGYDAGYYGYGWAEVYASDLFSAFRQQGLFNAEAGRKLRREVLGPCATRTAPDMLQAYLGRAPSKEAYLKEHGF
eukprot:TRINITY_DN2172_c0_g1_i1.p1 TRINITY_DN2172_c0_g1~~TRINITY_DN2172_c0_g1_i1.p1  ORF type:complete len:684 (+),score=239.20 TRINITY_DN2172_c0_g1_i1:61-2052(+)